MSRNQEETRILVVEDDPEVREAAVMLIRSFGFEVVEAEDGSAALEILQSDFRIDILFSDVVMPKGVNGFELAREATGLRPGLGIILTSGYPESELEKSGLSESRFKLLGKPYSRAQLREALSEALSS